MGLSDDATAIGLATGAAAGTAAVMILVGTGPGFAALFGAPVGMLVAAPVTAIGAPALGRVARRYPAPIPAAAVASLEADLWASLRRLLIGLAVAAVLVVGLSASFVAGEPGWASWARRTAAVVAVDTTLVIVILRAAAHKLAVRHAGQPQ